MHLSGAASILGAINFICTSASFDCFTSYVPIRKILTQKKKKFTSLYKKIDELFAIRININNTFISCEVLHIVRGKAKYKKLKPVYFIIYRYSLRNLNDDQCAFYSTNTCSNSIDIINIQKKTARDLQNGSLIQTKNEINLEVNNTKNKDFFFILICSTNSLKLAFYQIRSNLKILFSVTSKTIFNILNEK